MQTVQVYVNSCILCSVKGISEILCQMNVSRKDYRNSSDSEMFSMKLLLYLYNQSVYGERQLSDTYLHNNEYYIYHILGTGRLPECSHGELQLISEDGTVTTDSRAGIVQFCGNTGHWMTLCWIKNISLTTIAANFVCRQLGYLDNGEGQNSYLRGSTVLSAQPTDILYTHT